MHLYISSSVPGIQSTVTFTPVEKDQSTLYGKTSQKSGISAKNCSFLIISEIIVLSSFLVNDTLFISWRERERSIKVIYYKGTILCKDLRNSHFCHIVHKHHLYLGK